MKIVLPKIFPYLAAYVSSPIFKSNFLHHWKSAEAEPSFRKVNLSPVKLGTLFPVMYSLSQALDWSISLWSVQLFSQLFTFQATLWVLQQPHKDFCWLQLAIHTQLAHHYIQYELVPYFHFVKCTRISSKYCMATSKHQSGIWKDCKPHQSDTPLLFSCYGKINRSTTLINSRLVMSSL